MAKLDKKKLQKLSPAARLKKLREIEEEDKKELQETETLIEEALSEIEDSEDTGGDAAPAANISELLGTDESLEGTVQSESKAEEAGEVEYSAITYSSDYTAAKPDSDIPPGKVEDTMKYQSASDDAMKSTASKTDLESSKKYSRG